MIVFVTLYSSLLAVSFFIATKGSGASSVEEGKAVCCEATLSIEVYANVQYWVNMTL